MKKMQHMPNVVTIVQMADFLAFPFQFPVHLQKSEELHLYEILSGLHV
jgi:hypothetical protein